MLLLRRRSRPQPHRRAGGARLIAVYAVGSLVCHQLPERSFHLWRADAGLRAVPGSIRRGDAGVPSRALRHALSGLRDSDASGRRRADVDGAQRALARSLASPRADCSLVYEWTTGHAVALDPRGPACRSARRRVAGRGGHG
jgi:hypothetical protein